MVVICVGPCSIIFILLLYYFTSKKTLNTDARICQDLNRFINVFQFCGACSNVWKPDSTEQVLWFYSSNQRQIFKIVGRNCILFVSNNSVALTLYFSSISPCSLLLNHIFLVIVISFLDLLYCLLFVLSCLQFSSAVAISFKLKKM